MPTPEVIGTLTGISTFVGLVALLGYFYFLLAARRTENSIRHIVEGEHILNGGQIVKILGQFTTDPDRLAALKEFTQHDADKAKALLGKLKNNVDLGRLNRDNSADGRRRLAVFAGFFFTLAVFGLAYYLLGPRPDLGLGNKSDPQRSDAADSSASPVPACNEYAPVAISMPNAVQPNGPVLSLSPVVVRNDAGVAIQFNFQGSVVKLPTCSSVTLPAPGDTLVVELWSCGKFQTPTGCDGVPYALRPGERWHVVVVGPETRIALTKLN